MIIRRTIILLVIAFVSCSLFAQQQNKLKWNEDKHDFGQLDQGDPCEFVFKFTNTFDHPIKLTKVKASCGCTTPTWSREEIAPGKEGEVKVKYNSQRVGTINKNVRIWMDTLPTPDVIYINGNIKAKPVNTDGDPKIQDQNVDKEEMAKTAHLQKYGTPRGAFRFEKVLHNLQQIKSTEKREVMFNYYNASEKAVTFKNDYDADPEFSVRHKTMRVEPGMESVITITVSGDLIKRNDGFFSKRVTIYTDEEEPNNKKSFTINGNFKREFSDEEMANSPKIVFEETAVGGGKVIEGEKWVYDFKFKNEGKSDLIIKSAKASCGCTASAPKDKIIPPGGESQIQATFNSKGRGGKQSKTITVKSNDLNQPTVQLRFTVQVEKDPFLATDLGPTEDK